MKAHTPGPWNLGGISPHTVRRTYRNENGRRCTQFIAEICVTSGREGEAEPNTLLIAATPELLIALVNLSNEVLGSMAIAQSAIRQAIGNTNYDLLLKRTEEARTVIAKATGGSQ